MTYLDNAREFLNRYATALDSLWEEHSITEYRKFCAKHAIECANGMARFVFMGEDFVIKVDYCKTSAKWCGGCVQEYKAYRELRNDQFSYLIAPVTKMKGGHHYYYVMPRVDSLAAEEEVWRISDFLSILECEWIDEHFNDIHDENFGFINGEAIVIDYGWRVATY